MFLSIIRNEVEFYTTIMPELLRFQASKTGRDTPVFNAIPKCYKARHDLLIMGNYGLEINLIREKMVNPRLKSP